MGRREQREQIFKLLFRVEFHSLEDMPEQVTLLLEDTEEAVSEKDSLYISGKYGMIQEKIAGIDAMINEKTVSWDTGRIGKVELTILRLAVYEMLYDEEIPAGVAINEAVDIAKKYGQKDSGSFVNAILAKFV